MRKCSGVSGFSLRPSLFYSWGDGHTNKSSRQKKKEAGSIPFGDPELMSFSPTQLSSLSFFFPPSVAPFEGKGTGARNKIRTIHRFSFRTARDIREQVSS